MISILVIVAALILAYFAFKIIRAVTSVLLKLVLYAVLFVVIASLLFRYVGRY